MLPQDELTEILQIKAFQGVDLDAIQESARTLAQSTNSMGRVWDGTEPDDFETLQGIGQVFEQRLYDAGICTFAAGRSRQSSVCKKSARLRQTLRPISPAGSNRPEKPVANKTGAKVDSIRVSSVHGRMRLFLARTCTMLALAYAYATMASRLQNRWQT